MRSSNFSQRQPGLSATSQDQRAKINDPVEQSTNYFLITYDLAASFFVPWCVSRLPPGVFEPARRLVSLGVPEILFA